MMTSRSLKSSYKQKGKTIKRKSLIALFFCIFLFTLLFSWIKLFDIKINQLWDKFNQISQLLTTNRQVIYNKLRKLMYKRYLIFHLPQIIFSSISHNNQSVLFAIFMQVIDVFNQPIIYKESLTNHLQGIINQSFTRNH